MNTFRRCLYKLNIENYSEKKRKNFLYNSTPEYGLLLLALRLKMNCFSRIFGKLHTLGDYIMGRIQDKHKNFCRLLNTVYVPCFVSRRIILKDYDVESLFTKIKNVLLADNFDIGKKSSIHIQYLRYTYYYVYLKNHLRYFFPFHNDDKYNEIVEKFDDQLKIHLNTFEDEQYLFSLYKLPSTIYGLQKLFDYTIPIDDEHLDISIGGKRIQVQSRRKTKRRKINKRRRRTNKIL